MKSFSLKKRELCALCVLVCSVNVTPWYLRAHDNMPTLSRSHRERQSGIAARRTLDKTFQLQPTPGLLGHQRSDLRCGQRPACFSNGKGNKLGKIIPRLLLLSSVHLTAANNWDGGIL